MTEKRKKDVLEEIGVISEEEGERLHQHRKRHPYSCCSIWLAGIVLLASLLILIF
jgi:hypothetical protein